MKDAGEQHTTVDRMNDPAVFVVHEDFQALPEYAIRMKPWGCIICFLFDVTDEFGCKHGYLVNVVRYNMSRILFTHFTTPSECTFSSAPAFISKLSFVPTILELSAIPNGFTVWDSGVLLDMGSEDQTQSLFYITWKICFIILFKIDTFTILQSYDFRTWNHAETL